MEVDEKVELRCLRPKWGEPVSILCYHQGWDNRNDYIVCGIFPVEFVSVVNEFQIFSNQKKNFTLHASQVISNAEDNFDPSTLSLLGWTSDVLNKSILKNKYDSLVDEATHIFDTIVLIFFRKKLMCVPYEIYVQSRYKDFMGRWSHEIQETNKLSIKLEIKKQDNK